MRKRPTLLKEAVPPMPGAREVRELLAGERGRDDEVAEERLRR